MKTRITTILAATAALLFGSALTLAAADKPASCCPAGSAVAQALCPAGSQASCPAGKADATKCDKCAAGEKCDKCAAGKCDKAAAKDCAQKTCPVSGKELGSMGAPYLYTYKQAGQPDRTVALCCKGCVKKFESDPAKYLAILDAKK